MKAETTKTKLVLSLLALGCTLTFLAFCMADDSGPGIPSGPVLESDAQPITELPFTIKEPGSYCLTQSLTHTDRYTNAIVIDANNVTIDLGGYSIIGPTTSYNETCSGIFMDMRDNIEIRNGTITNFPYRGIFGENSAEFIEARGHRIISVRVMSTGAEGILLWGLYQTIRDCTVISTQLELDQGLGGITCGPFSLVTGNVVSRNRIIGISAGAGCTIHNNTLAECSYGIIPGDSCSIINNTIYYMFDGILVSDKDGCLIKSNTIRESRRNGIHIEGHDNVIEENLVTSCEVGINFAYEQNVFANNRALWNGINFGGTVPRGVYDGGGNIGAGTFIGPNIGAGLQLKAKPRALKKMNKK
jgi:parallel beta-helix repeat protein